MVYSAVCAINKYNGIFLKKNLLFKTKLPRGAETIANLDV